jgi:undecaprenyl-diphosphatase
MNTLNEHIFYAFNSLAGKSPVADSAIVFIGNSLPWIILIFTIFYFLFFRKSVKKFFSLTCMVVSAALVTQFLKWQIFLHPRPFVVLPDVVKLINISGFDSFPSGHATIFAALATGVFIYNRRLGVVFMILALLIGMARIAAGVHYPFDILTGYGIGFVMAILTYRFLAFFSAAVKRFIS